MLEIKAPKRVPLAREYKQVFLAGSIEMGAAEPWQQVVIDRLATEKMLFLNPRRDDWDSSWKQTITDHKFKQQVSWELDGIASSDLVVMYFDPNTKSPITLLEFGALYKSGKLLVGCPPGFWRRGNLEVCCEREGLRLYDSLDSLIETLRAKLELAARA